MCGRFGLDTPKKHLAEQFDLTKEPSYAPRYNIAPTQMIGAILAHPESGSPAFRMLKWGLVPSWAKDTNVGTRLINARAETVDQKPSFRTAFRQRRCLIPASHFFEWQRLPDGTTQPHCIRLKDDTTMGFAGIWEHWSTPESNGSPPTSIFSCSILTTTANELMAPIHGRMPVIIPVESYSIWLKGDAVQVLPLLEPCPAESLEAWPIPHRVNSAKNDDHSIMVRQEENP
ncbi:SOS response-associated peptidase [Desulfovibrio ferrophilus]|uniref:Abasic site processing protein n=1 Tax=Desulfovibrio ferrophilus TaxID=241368 RepID=A0A2Z6AYQ2_9BACT|nr:SOS response-associated peptidase [Desulfovibrio ferrophilus]BBD08286.1 uncharacterized protein DFE_1560 [Desulfovibrio ferrophilus]